LLKLKIVVKLGQVLWRGKATYFCNYYQVLYFLVEPFLNLYSTPERIICNTWLSIPNVPFSALKKISLELIKIYSMMSMRWDLSEF